MRGTVSFDVDAAAAVRARAARPAHSPDRACQRSRDLPRPPLRAWGPAADPDRSRRRRQDPPRPRRRVTTRRPTSPTARPSSTSPPSPTRSRSYRQSPARSGVADRGGERIAQRARPPPPTAATAARPRQLRAPPGGERPPWRRSWRPARALQVLATSRAPLRLRSEHVLAVQPLGLPPPDQRRLDLRELARVESVALFAERARAVDPAFALDRRQRGRRRRDLPPAGRVAAGDRAGRGADAACCPRRRWLALLSSAPARPDRRPARRPAAAADPARRDRLELRPARPREQVALPPAGGLRRRLYARRRGGRRRRR